MKMFYMLYICIIKGETVMFLNTGYVFGIVSHVQILKTVVLHLCLDSACYALLYSLLENVC